MKAKSGQQNPVVLWSVLGVFVAGCGIYMYSMLWTSTPSAPPPPVVTTAPAATSSHASGQSAAAPMPAAGVRGDAAKKLSTGGKLDPTLHMEAMEVTESVVYAGMGRNIFSTSSAPVMLPSEIAARPKMVVPIAPARPPEPVGPPPPPPIDLKFFGTETAATGKKQAFLLHGEDVYLASAGEIVGRRYKVISVGTNSVVVNDMPNNNQQSLPLESQQ